MKKIKKPEKYSPEWHRLQIARKTVNMPPVMVAVIGGMTIAEAIEILKKYGEHK